MTTFVHSSTPTGDPPNGTRPTEYTFGAFDPQTRLAIVAERLATVAERLLVLLEKKFGDQPVDPDAPRGRGPLTNDTMLVDVLDPLLPDVLTRRLNGDGIHTVGQLVALTRTQLEALGKKLRLGQGGLDDVYAWLGAHGLALAPTPKPEDDLP